MTRDLCEGHEVLHIGDWEVGGENQESCTYSLHPCSSTRDRFRCYEG